MKVLEICLFVICFTVFACSGDADLTLPEDLQLQAGIERTRNVDILYSDSSRVRVRITSDLMLRNPDKYTPYQEFPEGIYVEFYDDERQVVAWLTANYAIRRDKENKVIARSHVILKNREDQKLETPELIWDEQSETVYSDKFVKITEPNGDVTVGFGFRSDQNFRSFEILSVESVKDIQTLLNETSSNPEQ